MRSEYANRWCPRCDDPLMLIPPYVHLISYQYKELVYSCYRCRWQGEESDLIRLEYRLEQPVQHISSKFIE